MRYGTTRSTREEGNGPGSTGGHIIFTLLSHIFTQRATRGLTAKLRCLSRHPPCGCRTNARTRPAYVDVPGTQQSRAARVRLSAWAQPGHILYITYTKHTTRTVCQHVSLALSVYSRSGQSGTGWGLTCHRAACTRAACRANTARGYAIYAAQRRWPPCRARMPLHVDALRLARSPYRAPIVCRSIRESTDSRSGTIT